MKINIKEILKKSLKWYNICILICIIIILILLFIIFKQKGQKPKTVNGIKVISSTIKEDEEIKEEEARKMTVKQFKKLGENISEEDLNVTTIRRSGELYYYIQSQKNTLEIKIKGGEITRINSVIVE